MDFDLNDEQKEIKQVAHDLLAARSPFPKVREAAEAGAYDSSLWSELVELGLADELAATGIPTKELISYDRFGSRICVEPRGLAAGYAALSPDWPDDPRSVSEANAHPEVMADKTVGQVADHFAAICGRLERMPEATPRCSGGTLPMMEDVLGAENMPWPSPLSSSSAANRP